MPDWPWVIVAIAFGIWVGFRIIAWLIIYLIQKLTDVEIKEAKVGFLKLYGIKIIPRNGIQLEIENVWFTSSFINHEVRKPLAIYSSDVRIQLDLAEIKRKTEKSNSPASKHETGEIAQILRILQYVGFVLDNLHIVVIGGEPLENCMSHVVVQQLSLAVSAHQHRIYVHFRITSLSSKLLQQNGDQNENVQPCIGDLSFSKSVQLVLDTEKHVIELLTVNLLKPHCEVNSGFLELVETIIKKRKNAREKVDEHSMQDSNNTFDLLTFLPKSSKFNILDAELAINKEARRRLAISLKDVECSYSQSLSTDINLERSLELTFKDISAGTLTANLLSIASMSFETKIASSSINYKSNVKSIFLGYHYNELHYWLDILKSIGHKRYTVPNLKLQPEKQVSIRSQKLFDIIANKTLHLDITLHDSYMMVATETCNGVKGGVVQIKLTSSFTFKSSDVAELDNFIQEARVDIEMSQLYLKLTENASSLVDLTPRLHHWNTIIYVGMTMFRVQKIFKDISVDSVIDSVQLEWSNNLSIVLSQLLEIFPLVTPTAANQMTPAKQPVHQQPVWSSIQINLQLTSLNTFICNSKPVATMLRIDTLTCLQKGKETRAKLVGAKLVYHNRKGHSVGIHRSHDIHNYVGHLRLMDITYEQQSKDLNIKLSEEVYLRWSTALHMSLLSAWKEVIDIYSQCKVPLQQQTQQNLSQTKKGTDMQLFINICANSLVTLRLSKDHSVGFSVPVVSATHQQGQFIIEASQASITFDQHEIFKMQGIVVSFEHHSELIAIERQGFDLLTQPTNRCWSFCIEKLEIAFPYNYNFAECFSNLLCINKWRKLVHNIKKNRADSPLPSDIVIKIKDASLQIEDDPFEVRLGDNYELLEDEWVENEKRHAALDKRIQELRMKLGLLPTSKVDELYNSLNKRNSEVYIQRSRQLYTKSSMRKRLFTWVMEGLEIIALADPALNGKDNVVENMKDIDVNSPYPEDLEFTTLWCRMISGSFELWQMRLRDYSLPMLELVDMHLWGRLIGAEQVPTQRATRSYVVDLESPWEDSSVIRCMPALKFYHDFSCELTRYQMAYGPCWEPAVAMFNMCMNRINRPSVDPSLPLPFWDKARLLFHGRLTMDVKMMSWLYHASLDPNNTTEFMDWNWTNLLLDWTNAKFLFKGDLDVFVKTASKYDDCRLLHLPNIRLCVNLDWLCVGDPNDHHSVMPCAPDKVPEFSLQEHDSYRAFRSQNLNLSLTLETKPSNDSDNVPRCLFYASTIRWLDKLKTCMARVSRPIRRGKFFGVLKPRKPQLTRHYNDCDEHLRNLNFSIKVHEFQVCYWMSFAKQHGVEINGGAFSLTTGLQLSLSQPNDELIHRPLANWAVQYFQSNLNDIHIWLCSASEDKDEEVSMILPVKKNYFLSVEKVTYKRNENQEGLQETLQDKIEKPTHNVQVYNLKGAWTPSNRNVALRLYDGYVKAQTLRKNLGADALKAVKVDSTQTPNKSRTTSFNTQSGLSFIGSPSPTTKLQMGQAYSMLQKLVSEADSRTVRVDEDTMGGSLQVDQLHAIAACQTDDIVETNFHIELHNSQVMLRGCETSGYVIVSAAKAAILYRDHEPVWRDRQLKSKSTWMGSVDSMQYYGTVDPGETSSFDAATCRNVMWLKREHIEVLNDESSSENSDGIDGLPQMVGGGQSVGGVVFSESEEQTSEGSHIQLQRIISRCRCQFFYANYGEVDPEMHPEVPPPPESLDMMQREEGVDSLALLHHDLNICTNSQQYAMILDLVNNLLLYVEPRRKEANERLQNMRFQLALSHVNDQRTPILQCQNDLRAMVATLRRLEKELYLQQKVLEEGADDAIHQNDILVQIQDLEHQMNSCKEQILTRSEELDIYISCYKESQLQLESKTTTSNVKEAPAVRINELCFKHAEWRMTESDGQIGIADLVLNNFLYSKINREDDCGSHQLELGWVKVVNLLPNTLYKDVLVLTDKGQGTKQMALRILCRFKAPVGGISIKEHFEVNVLPVTLQLTYRFHNTVMAFFFPDKDAQDQDDSASPAIDEADVDISGSMTSVSTLPSQSQNAPPSSTKPSRKTLSTKAKTLSCPDFDQLKQDINKMKERAAKNNMFLYVKIPEVPMTVSYKGLKEKNIHDVQGLTLLLPMLEYHNQTWTWYDFLQAVKKDTRKVLLGQAIKQKLHMKSRTVEDTTAIIRQEVDKARLLLGSKLMGNAEKPPGKKSLFGKSSK